MKQYIFLLTFLLTTFISLSFVSFSYAIPVYPECAQNLGDYGDSGQCSSNCNTYAISKDYHSGRCDGKTCYGCFAAALFENIDYNDFTSAPCVSYNITGNYGWNNILSLCNDLTSSVGVHEGFCTILWEDNDKSGSSIVLCGDDSTLVNNSFNDKTSSIEVAKCPESVCGGYCGNYTGFPKYRFYTLDATAGNYYGFCGNGVCRYTNYTECSDSGCCVGSCNSATGYCESTGDDSKCSAGYTCQNCQCVLETYTLTVSKAGKGSGTVTSNPAGINCGTDCSESYDSGTSVTLTASPATGSTFAGWSGNTDCSDGTVTMDASKSCTATFTGCKSNGGTCSAASDCCSGYCVDGVCCNSACTGTCQACNLSGSVGTCKTRAADDNVECAANYWCDGSNTNCVALSAGSRTLFVSPNPALVDQTVTMTVKAASGDYYIWTLHLIWQDVNKEYGNWKYKYFCNPNTYDKCDRDVPNCVSNAYHDVCSIKSGSYSETTSWSSSGTYYVRGYYYDAACCGFADYEDCCVGGSGDYTNPSYVAVKVLPSCSGTIDFWLYPDTANPSEEIVGVIEPINCEGRTAYVKQDSCQGTQKCTCSVTANGCVCTFTAPDSSGEYTYYGCVDKNNDGDFVDDGEADSAVLTINSKPTASLLTHKLGCIWPLVELKFKYSDPDGDDMAIVSSYQIQIAEDDKFITDELLLNKIISTDPKVIKSGSNITHFIKESLPVKTLYYWRVKVKDSKGAWSDWAKANFDLKPM